MDQWDQGRLALRLGIGGLLGALTAMAGFAVGSIFGARVMPTIVLLLGSSAVHFATIVSLSRFDQTRLSALLNQLVPRSAAESGSRTSEPLSPGEAVQAIEAELRKGRRDRAELQAISLALQPVLEAVCESRVTASEPDLSQILEQFMIELRRETTSLLRLSDEVLEASDRIGKGAGDQADTLTATTTTVEDLSEKIDRISQNAEEATTACFQTRQESKRGRNQLSEVVSGIERLRERVEANGKKARRLGDRSVEIGTIVELINGLAQRTDMLALNATIESVRAGEHGRGFAVVAEEIRKLAERAADATREIGTLVEAIQADVHESVLATAEEQAEMEREAARIHEAGEALERIGAVAERSALLVEGISASATGQVQATQNLVRAMQRMSMVSQATSDAATRSRERVEKLAAHARKLRQLSAASAEPPSPSPAPANCNGNGRVAGGGAPRSRIAGVST